MLKKIDLIKGNKFFQNLSRKEINSYLNDGSFKICTYGKNNIIHFSGDQCLKLEIMLSGKLNVERIDEKGNLMIIAEFFDGDIVGGHLLFSKNPYYPMNITAKQPSVLLSISKDRLFSLFSDNQSFLRDYLELLSDNVLILRDKLNHYMNRTIREVIMNYLQNERKKHHSERIELNMTKKSLAEKMGVQRTSLSRELAKMQKDGLIVYDKKSITLVLHRDGRLCEKSP